MNNMDKYQSIISEILQIPKEECHLATTETIDAWDSVGKLGLVAALEEEFSIELEVGDILQFNSYDDGIRILAQYGIRL